MKKTLLSLVFLCPLFSMAQWTQIGADFNGSDINDYLGESIALSNDGRTIAIATPGKDDNGPNSGQVSVYEESSGSWVQVGQSIDGENSGDELAGTTVNFSYPRAVALNGDGTVLAVGASSNDGNGNNAGHVRVFALVAGIWTQIGQDIDGMAASEYSGIAVDLNDDGTVVAIGGVFSNIARVYENVAGSWVQRGSDIVGENTGDQFGGALSLSANGNTLAVGGMRNDGNGTDSGHVRVFNYTAPNWVQVGNDIDGEAAGDQSGSSISLSANGGTVAIGAIYNTNNGAGSSSGHVRVYTLNFGNWVQVGNDIDSVAQGDEFGYAVSLSGNGDMLAVGARLFDGAGPLANARGHVRVFENNLGNWNQIGADIVGDDDGDEFGRAVALNSDGSILAVGAPVDRDVALRSGLVRVYEQSSLSVQENQKQLVSLHPNPATGSFQVSTFDTVNTISIVDISGKVVKYFESVMDAYAISDLKSGIYFINIQTEKGKITKKLIKQ